MLSMLFETGHPWITFKDPCNLRSPQQHVGVVHSSNLCTEITLNTSDTETAVCNLGSVNLLRHLKDGPNGKEIDHVKLQKTITIAMRMLDNVIDINYYAVKKARDSNVRHRPVGLGLMAFQDALYEMRIPYASTEAVEFADRSMEAICYHAYWASTELAKERGAYSSYKGSLWDKGILPLDTLDLLERERGGYVEVDRTQTLDWEALRKKIAKDGMRNSNCVAIAPTATISNIIGVDASIEPCFGNLSVKSNLSGEFTIINSYLVRDLKRLGLWDDVMVMDLKHFDGSLRPIDRVPESIKSLYATAFEVETKWLVEAAARRQKWIDQAQSLNIYMAGASGKKLDETYKLAWLRGLKTTYYLRTMSATHAESDDDTPLLLFQRSDLGGRLWCMDFDDPTPTVLINSKIDDWEGEVHDLRFQALVFPEIARQIAVWSAGEDDDDENPVAKNWRKFFARQGAPTSPPGSSDSEEIAEWAERCADALATRQNFAIRYLELVEAEAGS